MIFRVGKEPLKAAGSNEVTVKFLFSPINPADISTVRGSYPISPALPAVPGSEGVAQVISVGSGVKDVKEGDLVVPNKAGVGTSSS